MQPMIEYLSSSQINLYMMCSLKYRFQYMEKLPRPFRASALAFGSAIHSALAWFHKEKANGNGTSLEKLYRIFDADWYAQKLDMEIRYKEGEAEMNLMLQGKELLGLYFQDPVKEIKGIEMPFTVPLKDPANGKLLGINLEGFIDLVEKDDVIVEFKTSSQSMNIADVVDHLQLTAYSYAYEMLYRRPPKLLKIINLVKNKKPKMAVLETTRSKSDHQRFYHLASEVLKGIRNRVFFPKQSFLCKDCEFEEPCKAWKGS